MLRRRSFLSVPAMLFLLTPLASATVTLVTSSGGLGEIFTVDWSTLGAPITPISNPFTLSIITASEPSGSFERVDQGSGWGGNFAPGTALLYTGNNTGGLGLGPINFTFTSGAISGLGFQIQNDLPGTFTATLEAFDSLNNSLGSVSNTGTSNGNADNSAMFIGILSDSPNMASVVVSTSESDSVGSFSANDFAIGPADVVVPEPGSFVLLGCGLIAVALWHRRRHWR